MIFSKTEYVSRLSKVKKVMDQKNMDILILTDPSNMNYLTGYDGWSFYVPQGVIISLDREQPVWFGRKQDSNGAKVTTYLDHENIIFYPEELIQAPPTHPYDFVSSYLHENNWASKNIGVEMDAYYYTAENHYRLTSTCPNANFHDATCLVNWVRLVKSDTEVTYMKEGAKLVQAGMRTAFDSIKPGVKQSFVAGQILNSLIAGNEEIKIGGEYSGLTPILASGISASASHLTPKDNIFNENEGTIIELAGVKHRYHCPLSRTVYCGKPDSKTSDTMKITNEGVENAISIIKPGKTAHDVAVAFWSVLEKYGIEKDSRLGYATGLGYPPDWGEHTMSIRKNDMTVLEPNVTFHMIAGMWMDTWGLEISETINVTENGCELLCDLSRNLHLV